MILLRLTASGCQIFSHSYCKYGTSKSRGLTKRNKDSQHRFLGCLLYSSVCCYLKGSPCYCTVAHGSHKISLTKVFWHRLLLRSYRRGSWTKRTMKNLRIKLWVFYFPFVATIITQFSLLLVTALAHLNPPYPCITPGSGMIKSCILYPSDTGSDPRTLYSQKISSYLRVGGVNQYYWNWKYLPIRFLALLSVIETDGGIFVSVILGVINTDFQSVSICMFHPLAHNLFEA